MGTLQIDRQPNLLKEFAQTPTPRPRTGFPERVTKNPFFFRNNPHPSRVRHIKGLLDSPVCSVMDAGYRESLPNLENQALMETMAAGIRKKEIFVPGIGLVPLQPTWVEQLQTLTKNLSNTSENTAIVANEEARKPSSRLSSRNSSRRSDLKAAEEEFVRNSCPREVDVDKNEAFSRKSLSRGGRNSVEFEWKNANLEENELKVARLLSQILKTDSLDVIKGWLVQAPEKEKEIVLEMLRNVSNTNLEFREVVNKLSTNNPTQKMPDIANASGRLSVASNSPRCPSNGKENTSNVLDVIKENIEADLKTSSRSSSRGSQKKSADLVLPPITRDDQEIEAMRSRLASRSNISVFPSKSSTQARSR